jgi:hypothetical protein
MSGRSEWLVAAVLLRSGKITGKEIREIIGYGNEVCDEMALYAPETREITQIQTIVF